MASKSLIAGSGQVYGSQGFVDYGKDYKPSKLESAYSSILASQEKEKQEVNAITNKVNASMSNMSDMDLSDITFDQKTTIKNYLVGQRNIYAQAANEIAYISDSSSSEYQYYADIMSEVNNNISNLSGQLKNYKEAKVQYEADNDKRIWSGGVGNAAAQSQSSSIYGFDEENKAQLQIGDGGNMQFNYNNNVVNWTNHKDPYLKNFKTAEYITNTANTIANNRLELTDEKANTIRLTLDNTLADDEALRSLVAGDFEYEGINLKDIIYNEKDPNATKKEVIDRIINGYKAVGARSKAEYGNEDDPNKKDNINTRFEAKVQAALKGGQIFEIEDTPNDKPVIIIPKGQEYKGIIQNQNVMAIIAGYTDEGAPIFQLRTIEQGITLSKSSSK